MEKYDISNFESGYKRSQIAIALSHFHAYKEISEKYDQALIFEDDVILSENFTEQFLKYINDLPIDYDMLFIGDGCNLHIQSDLITPDKYIYKKEVEPASWSGQGAGRCTDSYLVSKKCATKMHNYLQNVSYKINVPVDFWLNVAARDCDLRVFWAEPTIVTQGTQNGTFITSHD